MNNICYRIHQLFNSMKRCNCSCIKNEIPQNGIYILFEKGELAHSTNRIVRVGTHTGENNLPSRLIEHFVKENKDRSIFRKNIGRAILNKNNDPYLKIWDKDLTSKKAKDNDFHLVDFEKQKKIEKMVSQYIKENISFIVFEIKDKEKRLELESKIIYTISACKECNASSDWLGNYSPKKKIRESGLWLENELCLEKGQEKKSLNDTDIKMIEDIIKKTDQNT